MEPIVPGPNAGAPAAALGGSPDTPGVAAVVGGGQASVVVAVYLSLASGAAVQRRHDIL